MRFAHRIDALEDKELLSLMELADAPDMISFSGGFPSPETYPIDDIKDIFSKVLTESGKEALSYSSTKGYEPLREQISQRMNVRYQMNSSAEDIIITSGSQQVLDMSGLLFLNKGDVVLFETPSYLGALNALKAYEAELVAVPTDEDGIKIDALKTAFETYKDRIKLIYVIPDFQNPSNRCWSAERRKSFMSFVSEYDVAVLEDAAYSELAFDDIIRQPLISYDKKGQVVYCGSFSKTFCPGLRVAWLCTSKLMAEKYLLLKSSVDLSSPSISQRVMETYMRSYDYDGHIRMITKLYRQRRDFMIQVIQREFPASVTYNVPQGGLFLWVCLPEEKDARALLDLALKNKVAFVPGGSFYPGGQRNNEMRINFSNMSEEKIETGIKQLGQIIREYIGV